MNQSATGKFIARKRKEKAMTQEQLAELLGVSNKTVSKWETGKCMPDYSIIKPLCNELNITVSELMDGEEQEQNSVRLYDEEQIMDLLQRTQNLEKMRVIFIVFATLFISESVYDIAERFDGTWIEVLIIGVSIILNFFATYNCIKCFKK